MEILTNMSWEKYAFVASAFLKDDGLVEESEILRKSKIQAKWNNQPEEEYQGFDIIIKVPYPLYKKHKDDIQTDFFRETIEEALDEANMQNNWIKKVEIDYDSVSIDQQNLILIETPWEKVNQLQSEIKNDLEKSKSSIEFQKIGMVSREALIALSNAVFNTSKHLPEGEEKTKFTKSHFKNRLKAYVQFKFNGSENVEIRKFMDATFNLIDSASNLAQHATHKPDNTRYFAYCCGSSTIQIINLIKHTEENE